MMKRDVCLDGEGDVGRETVLSFNTKKKQELHKLELAKVE